MGAFSKYTIENNKYKVSGGSTIPAGGGIPLKYYFEAAAGPSVPDKLVFTVTIKGYSTTAQNLGEKVPFETSAQAVLYKNPEGGVSTHTLDYPQPLYAEPYFKSEKLAAEVPTQKVNVSETRGNWVKTTVNGQTGWLYRGSTFTAKQHVYSYAEPDLASIRSNQPWAPQTFTIIDWQGDWMKIDTQSECKWIYMSPVHVMLADTPLYADGSFDSEKLIESVPAQPLMVWGGVGYWRKVFVNWQWGWMYGGTTYTATTYTATEKTYAYKGPSVESGRSPNPFAPQTFSVIDKTPDGWMKILTASEYKWIKPANAAETFLMQADVPLYEKADFASVKLAETVPLQEVEVLARQGNWIQTTVNGQTGWMFTGESFEAADRRFTFKLPTIYSEHTPYTFAPQTYAVVDKTTDGWARVVTATGYEWLCIQESWEVYSMPASQPLYSEPDTGSFKVMQEDIPQQETPVLERQDNWIMTTINGQTGWMLTGE